MPLDYLDYLVCASFVVLSGTWIRTRYSESRLPLPPGPPRWPLIGCLLSFPRDEPNWKVFLRWGKAKKSHVIYAPIIGDKLVILNSVKAAVELLERRSSQYSGRPRLVMGGELVGWNQILGLTTYGNTARRMRRLLHDGMGPQAMQTWKPYQEQEVLKFLRRLLHTPQDLIAHIRQAAGASVVKLTYGYTVQGNNDEYIRIAELAMDSFSTLTMPGAFMVDALPWLQYIPWAPFKKVIPESRKLRIDLAEVPMEFVRKQMSTGKGEPSIVSRWLETPSSEKEYEHIVKYAAASLYAGGADTTVSAITTFFIGMLYNPTAQRKAQNEISQLLPDRLPTSTDREQLPYVEAIYKEVLRWQPIAPLGLPHLYMGKTDDQYEGKSCIQPPCMKSQRLNMRGIGMRIPVGAILFANIWGILRDPSMYKNPDEFNPERFLGPNAEPDPENVVFGFGRRRCPGISIAQSSVWLSIALTLAAYVITPTVDKDGNEVLPSLDYSNQTISHPPPFSCNITPRSERMKKIIEEVVV